MLEDVLLIEERHKNAAKQIIDSVNIELLVKKRGVISIGGESGSGKSELAHMVSKLLKEKDILTKILHTDDFYKIHPKNRTEWRKSHPIDDIGLNEYDWNKINEVLSDYKEKKIVKMPCVDIVPEQLDYLITDFSQVDLVVLEGLYAVNSETETRVFIDLNYHETKKAQILRGKEPQTDFRLKVLEREHEVISSLRKKATIIINKDYEIE